MQRKFTRFNKILSAILAAVLFLGAMPLPAFSVDSEQTIPEAASVTEPRITLDGVTTDFMELRPHEKVDIQALSEGEITQYQWQILHPEKEDLWINIGNANAQSISVTLALVGNMLNHENVAQLRCRMTVDGEQRHTSAITVQYIEEDTSITVVQETEPVTEATEPVEETEPDTEATEPAEETEPDTEATEPAEETEPDTEATEPAEETEPATEATEPAATTAVEKVLTAEVAVAPKNAAVPLAEEEDADSDFVTVTIEYMRYDIKWEDGKMVVDGAGNPVLEEEGVQAFTSYIATLQKGTNLVTSVKNPTMVGYDTFLADATTTSTQVDINLTNITSNVVYTVKYKPAKVTYAVRYFFQNIYDDLYAENSTLKPTENGMTYTGATPPENQLQGAVPGFTALYYQPDSVAADGSTVFEVYYERNYYLMEFDCNGGYGAETLYNRYDSYVSVPTPVRPGYVFVGWDLVESDEPGFVHDDDVEEHLNQMPHYHTAYKAVWTTSATTYTVVYWRENADDDGYSYWGSAQKSATSAIAVSGSDDIPTSITNVTINGKTVNEKKFFTYNALLTDKNVIVEGDGSTVVNVYYTRNVYSVYFTGISGKCAIPEHTHTDGTCEKRILCGQGDHVHSDECVKTLICNLSAHATHTSECLICGKMEHPAHTDSCYNCEQEAHTHSLENGCYQLNCTKTSHTHTTTDCGTKNCTHEHDWSCLFGGCSHKHTDACYDCGLIEENHSHTISAGCYDLICEKTSHEHSESCGYKDEIHIHDTSCYKDEIHTHTDSCYSWTCGASAHTHTDECYGECLKLVHTHTTQCRNNSTSNVIYVVTAKYNQTIGLEWPTAANFPNITFRGWSIDGSSSIATSKRVNMTEDLCDTSDGIKYADAETGGSKKYLYYMFESFDQTTQANGNERILRNGVYYDKSELYYQEVNSSGNWNQKQITGMKAVSNGVVTSGSNIFLYYTRERVDLKFHNINTTVQTVSDLMYEYPLKDIKVDGKAASAYVPPYPTTYEPGAYEFGGWYTTPECFPGTEVDWTNGTLPSTDMEVYAKWTPILRTVTFYSAYSDIQKDKDDTTDKVYHFMKATDVPHGTNLGSTYYDIPEWPEDLDRAPDDVPEADLYDFIGWFYLDEDNKKRFAPDSMEVTRDLILFAEWNTSIDTTYEVKYVLKNAVSAENVPSKTEYAAGTVIADTDAAHASVGKTKTFTAKGLGDLYPDFQKKFFPTVNSHSILMEQQDVQGSQNKFSFEYVYDDTVYYKVRYVDEATRTELRPPKIDHTDDAVITVKFLPIEGYIPKNFYIRKALASDGPATGDTVIEENVITFYYVQDTKHGMFSIEYYLENEDSTDARDPNNYTQYESIVGSADINTTYTAEIRNYSGYTYQPAMNTVIYHEIKESGDNDIITEKTKTGADAGDPPSGPITYAGLTIKMYHSRNEYPYIVKYVESGSNKELEIVKSDKAKFDSEINHTAPAEYVYDNGTPDDTSDDVTYEYYLADSTNEQRTKKMTIRESASGAENTMIFYYTQKEVQVQYHPVCLDPNVPEAMKETMKKIGTVSLNAESAISATNLGGSNATAADGFRFVGWFVDEECTKQVDSSWLVGTTHLKPQTLYQDEDWINHYYARFEPVKEDLKITKQAAEGTNLGSDTFLFKVTGKNVFDQDVELIVSIQGQGSMTIKDLYCGAYTVTELTDWSWTYTPSGDENQTVKLTTNDGYNTYNLTFTNEAKSVDWLNGESAAEENQFN